MPTNGQGKRDWAEGFKTSGDVAAGCQWVRWMANGKSENGPALLVIAVGVNSVAASLDPKMNAVEVAALLELEAATISDLLRSLRATGKTHGARPRPSR